MEKHIFTLAGTVTAQTLYIDSSEVSALIPNEGGTDIYLKGVPDPITVNDGIKTVSDSILLSPRAKEYLKKIEEHKKPV